MKITWNLRMLCAQKGIWSGAELGRRLRTTLDLEISPQTISVLLRGGPKNVSLNMLLALCVALDCTPNDLLVVDRTSTRRTGRALAEAIMATNLARARKRVPKGPRRRKPAAPPATR